MLLRAALVVVFGVCLWTNAVAKAADVEYLMVPSAAMERDIPVAFRASGPHAVVLLDDFNAAPDVSNWVAAGNAMNTLAGKGISVVAPAGGAWSLYTDWEQDGGRQWETFLSSELPDWLVANKGLAPGGHAIVGSAQGGTGALMMAAFHPDRYRYAGSMSGFLTRRPPPSTARSPPVWRSTAASTSATCGACRSWVGGSGTTPTCTRSCW
jgi:S-formylglutathione hydrolase FrmB